MADNKNSRRPQDSQRININEDYEVQYWTKTLNISRDQLVSAVRKAGVMVNDVKKFLGQG